MSQTPQNQTTEVQQVIIPTLAQIVAAVEEIGADYQSSQGLILSEDDLKCHIFRKMYDLITDHSIHTYNREVKGSPLHTEIRFYDEHGKLCLIPDITILDPKNMTIKHGLSIRVKNNKFSYGELPRKQFEFGGKSTIIEIKFFKDKDGISASDVQKVRDDVEKIQRIMEINSDEDGNHGLNGVMVVFNKTNKKDTSFDNYIATQARQDNLEFVYCTGNVQIEPSPELSLTM